MEDSRARTTEGLIKKWLLKFFQKY